MRLTGVLVAGLGEDGDPTLLATLTPLARPAVLEESASPAVVLKVARP